LAAPLLAVSLAACSGGKRPPALTSTPGDQAAPAADSAALPPATPAEEGPDVQALEGEAASGADIAGGAAFPEEGGPLADVLFDYDSAALSDAGRAALEQHAAWLRGQAAVRATIEGHCDERGTVEYNLALGEQRARTVRDFLAGLGVSADRLRVVSYGKERPLDLAASEAAYARNRRVHFALSR
jgi:peptidoglycan-associated lipoprotein